MRSRPFTAFAIVALAATFLGACSRASNDATPTSPPPDSIVAAVEVPFTLEFSPVAANGSSTTSATGMLQNTALTTGTAGNSYSFTLAPNTYTVTGQMSLPGGVIVDLEYKAPANCNGPPCLGGVVPGSVASTITCGGTTCDPSVAQQTVNACDVVYTIFGSSGVPIASPVEFQMQFAVNGSITASGACP
jgi:hypothetical protein